MEDWQRIRQMLFDAFAAAPRPDFTSITVIGCCERHERDFDWYRQHTWQEFEAALETRGFDPGDFVAIDPLAFHYFTPGVLSAAVKRLATEVEGYWHDDSWILHYVIAPGRIADFQKQYLPHYDLQQRQAVAATLAWYKSWFLAQNGYDYDEPDDDGEESGKIVETIALVWQSEL